MDPQAKVNERLEGLVWAAQPAPADPDQTAMRLMQSAGIPCNVCSSVKFGTAEKVHDG